MVKAVLIDGSDGNQFDLFNAADQWVGWVSRHALGEDGMLDDGIMVLMSTGAPLDDSGRISLATAAARALGEPVSLEVPEQ